MSIRAIKQKKKELQKRFGKRVRELREAKGMTKTKLGALMDKEIQQVTRIETGKYNFTIYTMIEVAVALNVPFSTLFDFEITDLYPDYAPPVNQQQESSAQSRE